MPPYLIIVGTADRLVGFRQSKEFCDNPLEGAPRWLVRWENHAEWEGCKGKVTGWLKKS
jgi:hypothetical protein